MSEYIKREDVLQAIAGLLNVIENIPEVPPKETLVAEPRFSEEEQKRLVKECVDKIVVRCVDCKYQDSCYKSVTVVENLPARTRRSAKLKACSAGRRKDELSDER